MKGKWIAKLKMDRRTVPTAAESTMQKPAEYCQAFGSHRQIWRGYFEEEKVVGV